jgi:hypothetical protein
MPKESKVPPKLEERSAAEWIAIGAAVVSAGTQAVQPPGGGAGSRSSPWRRGVGRRRLSRASIGDRCCYTASRLRLPPIAGSRCSLRFSRGRHDAYPCAHQTAHARGARCTPPEPGPRPFRVSLVLLHRHLSRRLHRSTRPDCHSPLLLHLRTCVRVARREPVHQLPPVPLRHATSGSSSSPPPSFSGSAWTTAWRSSS